MTKVSQAARSAGSSSAASKAPRTRLRTSSALSSDLTWGALASHSSWPKYEYCEPPATISVSYSSTSGVCSPTTGARLTLRAARSNPVTSASSTRTLGRRLKIARSGKQTSPSDRAPVAT